MGQVIVATARGRLTQRWPALFSVLLVATASVLWLLLEDHARVGRIDVVLALLVGFLLSEVLELDIEMRRQTFVVHFAEVPLVIGLYFTQPLGLILARTGAALLVAAFSRIPRQKTVFNLTMHLTACLLALHTWDLLHASDLESGRTAMAAAVAALTVAGFEFLCVQTVIGVLQSRLPNHETALTAWTLFVAGLASTTTGLLVVILLQHGGWHALLVAPFLGVCFLAYRAYSRLLGRHLALERLYGVARSIRSGARTDATMPLLLERACSLLNAEQAALFLPPDAQHSRPWGARTVDGGCSFFSSSGDLIHDEVSRTGSPMLLKHSVESPEQQEWLAERGVRDAIVVPVPGEDGAIATLEVAGFLGDTRSFAAADRQLLETLATHVGFALQNSSLLEQLSFDATHDELTGLANRASFLAELSTEVTDGRPAAVCIVDLDEFKDINDALGHSSGDQLLRAVALRLRSAAPATATVARLGGDEFAVLLREPGGAQGAEATARSLIDALLQSVTLEGAVIDIEGSMGVALSPEHGHDATSLLQHADIAMYAAKQRKSGVRLFDDTLDDGTARRLALVAELRQALRARELVVYYQPKVRLVDGELVGVEALVRWNHPTRGLVFPDDFIAIAEHTGLIAPLTTLVLHSAVAQCRTWLDEGKRIPVAVNISVRTLVDSSFADEVEEIIRFYGVPADMLTLELTETSIMSDRAGSIPVLTRLTDAGITISVDDFGTGYSSLAQLSRLPVSEVKIDKSFVFGMGTDANDAAVVRSVVQLAHHMGKHVVAEGVEDAISWRKLMDMGCDVAQGYLMSRPLPPERLALWLEENVMLLPLPERAPGQSRKAAPLRLVARA